MKLQIEHVSWGVNDKKIVRDVNLQIEPGEFVGLVGPNGSGKSSLLRCIYHVNRPHAGLITLDDKDVWQLTTRDLAQRAAAVLQETPIEFDFKVNEIVMMGRSPHKGMFDRDTEKDHRLVEESLTRVEMAGFGERVFSTLSGGEKQRVLVARALAQQAEFLALDEPTNHLDIYYQLEIMDLTRSLGVTTLVVLHDLNLAALYCDRIYVLKDGEIFASGPPEEVLKSDLICTVYGVNAEVNVHPTTGKLHITFVPRDIRRATFVKSRCES